MQRSITFSWRFCLGLMCAVFAQAVTAHGADDFVAPPAAERAAVATLAKQGGRATVDGEYRVTGIATGANCSDDDLKLLAACERLTQLTLSSPNVTDAGIEHLKGLTRLTTLTITTSGLTDEGIASLRTALPNCRISSFRGRGGVGGGPPGAGGDRGGRGGPAGAGFDRGSGRGPTFGSGGFLGTSRSSNLVRNAAVQDDLKLTVEQREKITATSDLAAVMRALDEKVMSILSSEQKARLKQIELQQVGAAGLLRDDVTKELKIGEDQKAAIRKLADDAAQKVRTASTELSAQRDPNTPTADLFAKVREKTAEINKERDAQIVAVLSPEQQKAWQTMLGPEGPKVSTGSDRGSFAGFASRTPAETAKSVFESNDANKDGTLTETEFPESNRTRRFMSRAGITLQLPISREDFEKAYLKYAETPRRRQ